METISRERAEALGRRLAASTMPELLKRELLDAIPGMGVREFGILEYALRHEEAQLGLLERALEDYEAEVRSRAPEQLHIEDAAIEEAVTKYLDDIAAESARKSITAS